MAVMAVHYQHERAQKKGGAYGSNKRATIKQVLFFLSFTNLGAFTPDGHCHYCQKGSLKGLVRYGQTPENSWRGWRTSRRHVQKQHFLRSQLRTLACPVGLGWSRRRPAGVSGGVLRVPIAGARGSRLGPAATDWHPEDRHPAPGLFQVKKENFDAFGNRKRSI